MSRFFVEYDFIANLIFKVKGLLCNGVLTGKLTFCLYLRQEGQAFRHHSFTLPVIHPPLSHTQHTHTHTH
eukprot:c20886_g1_i1 orf=36-245(+)